MLLHRNQCCCTCKLQRDSDLGGWLVGLDRGEGGYHCPVGLAPPRPLQPGGAPPLACTTRQKGVPLGACLDQGPGFYTEAARTGPVNALRRFLYGEPRGGWFQRT